MHSFAGSESTAILLCYDTIKIFSSGIVERML